MFNFLTGYKSIIGIISGIAAFVLLVCNQLVDGFQFSDIEPILTGFSALMVAIGVVSKTQRTLDAVKK